MSQAASAMPQDLAVAPRSPALVSRMERIGSFHPTRLSFMRSLLRRIAREDWRIECLREELDERGVGVLVFRAETPKGAVHLVGFSHDLPAELRTDRVIAERWDATFALTESEPDDATLERLYANVPYQEVGRVSAKEFVLCRANRSVRLFDWVVNALAEGRQPEPALLLKVGYLMRTTAVYGNGKFGVSDLANTFARGIFSRPFEAEMLAVYLVREFTFRLAAHLARQKAPETATTLSPETKRMLGIGNATGLGMAPFLIGHPTLFGRWIETRELALARVRSQETAAPETLARFESLLARLPAHLAEWVTEDKRLMRRIVTLREEVKGLEGYLAAAPDFFAAPRPWDRLYRRAEQVGSIEFQELVASLILEPQGALIDDLEDRLALAEWAALDPAMTLGALKDLIERDYGWALGRDYTDPGECHLFWYVSEEKLEPRLGERFEEQGADRESTIGYGREASRLHADLAPAAKAAPDAPLARFLLRHPEHRHTVRRMQALQAYPYGEIRDNLLAAGTLAVDMLRCKLSLFGACKFDPKSDRWTRINMYQGAPSLADLDLETADDWAFPAFLPGEALEPFLVAMPDGVI